MSSQADEQLICDYLLKIFRCAVVVMPRTASKFAKDLQGALLPMLNRPLFNTTVSGRPVFQFLS
jgi:cohesin loading factor subunit SCC2